MRVFDKCPNCHKHPMAIGAKPITLGDVAFDEWYCGECGHCVGATNTPTGPVPATQHAQDSWNMLVASARVN